MTKRFSASGEVQVVMLRPSWFWMARHRCVFFALGSLALIVLAVVQSSWDTERAAMLLASVASLCAAIWYWNRPNPRIPGRLLISGAFLSFDSAPYQGKRDIDLRDASSWQVVPNRHGTASAIQIFGSAEDLLFEIPLGVWRASTPQIIEWTRHAAEPVGVPERTFTPPASARSRRSTH